MVDSARRVGGLRDGSFSGLQDKARQSIILFHRGKYDHIRLISTDLTHQFVDQHGRRPLFRANLPPGHQGLAHLL